eukprot:TRINITY_DN101852_c0_g1_i1.p1 TRINITY_DN101852_c0_g1~~TRINITY_DN101852_c0_g1_i1.p1  ORF type:complete len:948 (+),score=177.87 TRINITY_DN101852_c0_g1_i1:75-2918(+)
MFNEKPSPRTLLTGRGESTPLLNTSREREAAAQIQTKDVSAQGSVQANGRRRPNNSSLGKSVTDGAAGGAEGKPGRTLASTRLPGQAPWDGPDIVQFSCAIYFVEESEGFAAIDVTRIGRLEGDVKVRYETQDASGKAGIRYRAQQGEILIPDGSNIASLRINIIYDAAWATTLEFKVKLIAETCVNCELGLYLAIARVKVIDESFFPSDVYKDFLEKGMTGVREVNGAGLMWEYLKLNFNAQGMSWRTLTVMCMDELNNLNLLLRLWLSIYMVDTVYAAADREETKHQLLLPSRVATGMLLGVMYLLPMFILHSWALTKVRLDVRGLSRVFIQTNLYRKYLNYTETSREQIPAASMEVSITHDASSMAEGYMAVLNLAQLFCKIVVLTSFALWSNPSAAWAVFAMPALLAIFGYCRVEDMLKASEKSGQASLAVADFVSESCQKYNLIADYQQRPQMNELLAELIANMRRADIPGETVTVNNLFFPKWCGSIFTAVYMVVAAGPVLDGAISLGNFLATISVLEQITSDFGEVYSEFITVASVIEPLRALTGYFNLPTDVLHGKNANRQRRRITKEYDAPLREKRAALEDPTAAPTADMIPIEVRDMSFNFDWAHPIFHHVNATSPQGSIVIVDGYGRTTLLRLLGMKAAAKSGIVFLPTHCRLLFVSREIYLLNHSLWKNLSFGKPEVGRDLVHNILIELHMERVAEMLKHELAEKDAASGKVQTQGDPELQMTPRDNGTGENAQTMKKAARAVPAWQKELTLTEKAAIHLARAFVMNPEILILSRPFSNFSGEYAAQIADLIKRHRSHRGLGLPLESQGRRRPRTVFLTVEGPSQMSLADVIWHIRVDNQQVDMVDPATVKPNANGLGEQPVQREITTDSLGNQVATGGQQQAPVGDGGGESRPGWLPPPKPVSPVEAMFKSGRTSCMSGEQFPFAAKACLPANW